LLKLDEEQIQRASLARNDRRWQRNL